MNQTLSVSQLNEQIKSLLETTFSTIYVQGEVSNLTYHFSGHIYFSIKDKTSTISCVMFKNQASSLKFRLEVGQKISITAKITAYTPRGTYQLLCSKIEPSGVGALALAYEQLKTKLQIKGYFDINIKKQLPKYPKNIVVITSNTGAAIEDMKKILSVRYPLAKMTLIPSLVQGDEAKYSITNAIKQADTLQACLIIVGRGGGSMEDLWAFNEEMVCEAIFEANTPIISAVGHENDFALSDFVADIRASTPSNAIEICTPDINELKMQIDAISDAFGDKIRNFISQKEQLLRATINSFEQHSFSNKFANIQAQIAQIKSNLNTFFAQKISVFQSKIDIVKNNFELNHPDKKVYAGYAFVVKDDKKVDINTLNVDDVIHLQNSKIDLECKITKKTNI